MSNARTSARVRVAGILLVCLVLVPAQPARSAGSLVLHCGSLIARGECPLIEVRGDPLQDVRRLQEVALVVKGGELVRAPDR